MAKPDVKKFEIGVIGLGRQGRVLARAFDEQRFSVVVFDRSKENIGHLKNEAPASAIHIADDLAQFVQLLRQLRTVIVTMPTATADWSMGLLAHLEPGDLLIDAGKCNFTDADRRADFLAERNVRYLGLGMVDGEEPGCCGSVLMSSGRPEIHESARHLLEAVAAKIDGRPCVSYLGRASAGHFVRIVHDGIEHGLRKLVLETREMMKRATLLQDLPKGTAAASLEAVGSSFLEFTGHVFCNRLPTAESAEQDECAHWTSQVARDLEVATPTIDAAAGIRCLSPLEIQNEFTTTLHRQPNGIFRNDVESILEELRGALQASVMITYAQGLAVLAAGSERYGYNFDLAEIARLWKGRCRLRASLLDDIESALRETPQLTNLLCDEDLSEKVMCQQEFLRQAAWRATQWRADVPTTMASLDYLDCHRGAWLPMNLIQIPGSHGRPAFERGAMW